MIGKVVGELVAVFGTSVEAGEMRLEVAVVDPALRQKRIGRFMLAELEKLARNLDVAAIVVDRAAGGEEFLRRCGFESDGVRWSRRIGD